MNPTLRLALLAALAALAAPGAEQWKLARPAPLADGRVARLDQLERVGCNECHAEVVAEWSTTLHALAWVSEPYRAELVDRKKVEGCWGCHAPQPLHVRGAGTRPDPRPDSPAAPRHFGVSCETCHLGPQGEMLGPLGAPTDKHATAKSGTMLGAGSNALCASCHRTTVGPVIGVAQDLEGVEGAVCVECHMAPLREVEKDGAKRVIRSHELQTPRDPAFLAQAFGLTARRDGTKTVVEVANRAGHRVPGFVGRDIELRATLLDAAGKELARGVLELDSSAYLPRGEKLEIELGGTGAKVHVVGLHHDPRQKDPVRFLELDLAP